MESTHLKESLAKLATLKSRSEQIQSDENRAAIKERTKGGISDFVYPTMCGQLSGAIIAASWEVAAAQRSAERLEVIEREHNRFVTIFEEIGIETDEETLATLELIGKRTYDDKPNSFRETSRYRDERNQIANLISKLVAQVQSNERDIEYCNAAEALLSAGFVIDDEGDYYDRGTERVRINLVNGRESRYSWDYITTEPGAEPNQYTIIGSGKSGEFSRLLDLITPKQSVSACGVATAVAPCETLRCSICGAKSGLPHHDESANGTVVIIDPEGHCQLCAEGIADIQKDAEVKV